jgi:hypothetical protein
MSGGAGVSAHRRMVIGILASEIMRNMALIGVRSPAEVGRRNLFAPT